MTKIGRISPRQLKRERIVIPFVISFGLSLKRSMVLNTSMEKEGS